MVRARHSKDEARSMRQPPVGAPPTGDTGTAVAIEGRRPLRFMALIWGIPIAVVIGSLLVRRFVLGI